jgi:hypothetical protein
MQHRLGKNGSTGLNCSVLSLTTALGRNTSREAPVPEPVRTVPHVAFEVDDLSAEIAGKEILIAPSSPSPGVTVSFIVENGARVEFLQFDKK